MKSIKVDLTIDELIILIYCLVGAAPSKDKEQQTAALYDRLNKIIAGI